MAVGIGCCCEEEEGSHNSASHPSPIQTSTTTSFSYHYLYLLFTIFFIVIIIVIVLYDRKTSAQSGQGIDRTRYGSPEDESSDEDQDDEELIPSPKEVRSDLEVLLTTPSGIIKTFVLDIAMGNPAAPRFFQGGKTPHLTPDTANDARDQEKLDHYGTHTTLVGRTPKVYYTFNVEATGRRLGLSSRHLQFRRKELRPRWYLRPLRPLPGHETSQEHRPSSGSHKC